MQVIFSLLASFGLIISSSMNQFNAICPHCSGFKIYGQEIVSQIQSEENIRLIGTKVTGPVTVKGHLYSENAQLQQVKVQGKATFINTNVSGSCSIIGELEAVDTHFQMIEAESSKIIFNHCTLSTLNVKSTESAHISLRKGTSVESIVFSGPEGVVHTDGTNSVGHIKNGKLINN